MRDSSPVFDADALLVKPPEVRIGGKVYRGRILSIVEWATWLERFLAVTEEELGAVKDNGMISRKLLVTNHAFCLEYLRDVLPGVKKGAPDPVAILERQGARLVKTVFAHFFGQQCYVQGVALRTPTDAARAEEPPTRAPLRSADGTNSSDRVPKAPNAGAAPS